MTNEINPTTAIGDNYTFLWRNVTEVGSIEKDHFSLWAVWTGAGIAIFSCLFGSIGNGATIFAYKRNRKLQTNFNHLVLNLCVIDLFFSLVILPMDMPLILMQYKTYPAAFCQIVDYLSDSMTSASVINLVFIAINRYVGIVHSSRYHSVYSRNQMRWWVLASWTSALIFYLPFILNGIHNQICLVGSLSFETNLTIYNLVLQNILNLFPTIVLISLYRAIFIKVKKSRKSVEHYPKPGSPSHTCMDQELEGSSRIRPIRRYSSSRARRTESLNTQKASGSPQNGNKSNAMTYLQVPDVKSTAKNDFKSEQENSDYLAIGSSSLSLDTQSVSALSMDLLRSAQSTPAPTDDTNIKDELEISQKHGKPKNGKSDVGTTQTTVFQSERQRRRMQDMRKLHILSTIDSESNSRSISCDNIDFCLIDKRTIKENPQVPDASNPNNFESINYAVTGTRNNSAKVNYSKNKAGFRRASFFLGSDYQGSINMNNAQTMPANEINRTEERTQLMSIVNETISSTANFLGVAISINEDEKQVIQQHLLQSNCSLKRQHSLSCADLSDSKSNQSVSSQTKEVSRRHSISTCSETKSSFAEIPEKSKVNRLSLKRLSWKRKRYHGTENELKKASTHSKTQGFGNRRVKSEIARTMSRRSWKRHWRRKTTNPANIKIVIEQATSEDTMLEPAETLRFYKHKSLNLNEANEETDVISNNYEPSQAKTIPSKRDSFRKSLKKSLVECKKSGKSFSDANALVNIEKDFGKISDRTWSKSAEQLPCHDIDRLPSTDKKKTDQKQNLPTPQNNKQVKELETKCSSHLDERRSSVTSYIYRYNGNDDNLSRNGSFSQTSYIDNCRIRSNRSPMLSRENSVNRRSGERPSRKRSLYNHWSRRKSFFSSFYSSNTSESRRKQRRREAEKHIAYNGIVICVAFAIIVLPSYVVGIINSFVPQPADVQLIVAILSWLHVVINPIIYGYMNPQFRAEYKQIWRKAKPKCFDCIKVCKKSESQTRTNTKKSPNVSNSHYIRSK